MGSLIQIKLDKRIKISKQIGSFLNPDFVYVPFADNYKLYIKSGDMVQKEEILLYKDHNYLYSPISGKILGSTMMQVGRNKMKTVVIENDFREKTKAIRGVKKYINTYSGAEVIALVKTFNAYDKSFKGETLLINGIDLEPYVVTNSCLISEYTNELLETIDAILEIFKVERCYLVIKNNDSENVETLINHLGTYPNISLKLMPDLYPLGHQEVLINEIVLPKYREDGVIYLTVEDIYAIYNVLKKGKPITEKLITVTGNLITKPKVIKVKIGTSLKDLINGHFKIKDDNYLIIINGLMGGYPIDTLDYLITNEVKSIFITTPLNDHETTCINCGMCHTKCPMGCNPRSNLMKNCISCGTCTYVCPAKLNFKGR